METALKDIVIRYGSEGLTHPYRLSINLAGCFITWSEPDNDGDVDAKILYALLINNHRDLICLWDNNYGTKFQSLDLELQKHIFNQITGYHGVVK